MELLKTKKLLLVLLISIVVFQSPKIVPTYAVTYTTPKISSGGSSYDLYLKLDTTSWTRDSTYYMYIGIKVNSFGSGMYDFHEIVLSILFDDGSGYEIRADSEWGMINTEGYTYEVEWYFTPSFITPDSFSVFIGSEFWEDVGLGDPFTDDGWTWCVDITINDPEPPLLSNPDDINYEEGVEGNEISWTAEHTNPDYYEIYQNSSECDTGVWESGTPIIYDIDNLAKGDYSFTIIVFDNYGHSSSDTVLVHVQDTMPPTINSPPDIVFEESTTGNYIIWSANDTNPYSYELKRDDEVIGAGSWEINTQLNFSLDGLEEGEYNYTITVTDESGLKVSDMVKVSVIGSSKTGSNFLVFSTIFFVALIPLVIVRKRIQLKDISFKK